MKNILGDSVYIEYEVSEKTICSNGYAYNYKFFQIPDTLSHGSTRFEGEWLLEKKGANKFAWWPEVNVQSDVSFAPRQEFSSSSSNDSILYVPFTKSYKGAYSLEFRIDNLFPRKYLMVIRTSTSIGGIFNIYFNDVLVKTIDTYDLSPWNYASVISGKYYKPKNGFNRYDCWVQNDNEYGNSWVRFEYVGPGYITSQGLIFDYIDFMPYEE